MKTVLKILIVVFLVAGVYAKVKSIQYNTEYERQLNYNLVSIPVDFSRSGEYEAECVHILRNSSMFYFQLICDLSDIDQYSKGELDNFKGYYLLTNIDGSQITKTEYCDFTNPVKLTLIPNNINHNGIDIFQDDDLYGEAYFSTGTYKIKLVVEQGVVCLKGKEQKFVSHYFKVTSNEDLYSSLCNLAAVVAFLLASMFVALLLLYNRKLIKSD